MTNCDLLGFIEIFRDLNGLLGKCETGNQWKSLYFMGKTMVSGEDVPFNHSIDG